MIIWSEIQTFIGMVIVLMHLTTATSENDTDYVIIYDRNKRHYDANKRGKLRQHIDNVINSDPSTTIEHSDTFATVNCTVITAQIAGSASLPCAIKKFTTGVVSWIRRKDFHLLTVGLATYSSDNRFSVEHIRHLHNWSLQIRNVQKDDFGFYECQISSHPPTSIYVELKVIEATAEIMGFPDVYVNNGSMIKLVCVLRHSTETPIYVFWYHEDRMVNYDENRDLNVQTQQMISTLIISSAEISDNGNYTCLPSNTRPASIQVHVLNTTAGDQPAAMQHANTNRASNFYKLYWMIFIMFVLLSKR